MRLLEYRAQIDVQDSLGNTPLHLACNNGHMETATLLLMVSGLCYSATFQGSKILSFIEGWPYLKG